MNESESRRSKTKRDPAAVAAAALDAALADRTEVDLAWIQPPPEQDGWTLAPDALRLLARLVGHLRPRHVLEFGSGLSTRVLGRSCAALGLPCRISSVDHDPEFGMAPQLDASAAGAGVRLRHQLAPVVSRDCGGKLLPLYLLRPGRFASRRPADLVLIDGPPVTLGGREGILYQAMDAARAGTLVLLDDAARLSERAACAHWQDNLGDAIDVRRLPGFAHGLAAVIVRTPVPRRTLWDRKLALTRQQIETIVAPGEEFVLAEQNYWPEGWTQGQRDVPFVLRDGASWGSPESDEVAFRELELRRQAGAGHFVLLWTAFWWLDTYPELFRHLRARYRCAVENDRLLAFDLSRADA